MVNRHRRQILGLLGEAARLAPMRRPTAQTCLRALVVAGLSCALLVAPGSVEAGKPSRNNNNYFKYVDESGVVHITNRPRGKKGDWKLTLSVPANRTNLAEIARAPGEVGTAKLSLDSEKAHRYDAYIRGAARRYQLPESFVRAVIHTESRYNPRAVSRAGAMGLMQLMPGTA